MKNVKAAIIKRLARECGFELAGITPAEPAGDAARFLEWVAAGMAGSMSYLTDHRAELRKDTRNLLPSANSIICVAKSYHTGEVRPNDSDIGWISRYAQGEDYHDVLRRDLQLLAERIQAELGPFDYRVCVDTAPLLERSYARLAGLGWIGKNTCLINQQYGSYVYLGELLVSLELEADTPAPDRCGTCTRCIDACPTDAITAGGLDATRCISYFTIELRGDIPESMRPGIGHHVFGCDVCQEVCPWNRKAQMSLSESGESAVDLEELAMMSRGEFRERFRRTPVWRTKYSGFLRNVAIALGNSRHQRFRPALEHLAQSEDRMVSEHAEWALTQLDVPSA